MYINIKRLFLQDPWWVSFFFLCVQFFFSEKNIVVIRVRFLLFSSYAVYHIFFIWIFLNPRMGLLKHFCYHWAYHSGFVLEHTVNLLSRMTPASSSSFVLLLLTPSLPLNLLFIFPCRCQPGIQFDPPTYPSYPVVFCKASVIIALRVSTSDSLFCFSSPFFSPHPPHPSSSYSFSSWIYSCSSFLPFLPGLTFLSSPLPSFFSLLPSYESWG